MDPIVPPTDGAPEEGPLDPPADGPPLLPVAPDGGDGTPDGSRGRRWPWVLGGVAVLLVLTTIGSFFLPTPYYRRAPGSVRTTESLIEVEGAPTFPDDTGDIGYTTITQGEATAFELVAGWLDPDVDILSREEAFGDQDPEENREVNLQAMVVSKDVAAAVALESIGYEVEVLGDGAEVLEVLADGPAAAAGLEPLETIVAVDDQPVSLAEDVGAALEGLAPGDVVRLTLEPPDPSRHPAGTPGTTATTTPSGPRTLEVTLGDHPDRPGSPLLGVVTATRNPAFDLPVQVVVDSGDVGGPSAGLAFTLGIIDVMTPGDLTGGRKVATTGTMRPDGTVGAIGGIEQKVAAVRDSGAEIFLVPVDNEEAARAADGGDLEIVAVATVDEALAALAERGGDVVDVEQLAAAPGG